ncbi:DUF1217 domain-containing protein [Paracoccus sp. MC1854]|uniref:DUF1217 domain-containing protein n=1 Tax=Paracoccus sp. MC1854 TaxID=2760306 RepID=UPI0016013AE0|nr:DUF1217 domain-containing protein [Paracoccus sp. MC1854]MBB1491716.1 DUF1217 domain-containing protein [Paracoccus sp. MC1854]
MSFQPVVGQGGYAGWRLLARTGEAQGALVARDPRVARDTAHVRAKLGEVGNAEELVSDFRLLRTSLSAFGLEGDANNRFFIRKVLESDLSDPKSLANRLSDKRYRAMAEAFRFGSGGSPSANLAGEIVGRHVSAELERRVGTIDGNLRLAMSAERELKALGASASSDNTRWYNILGSAPLRKVVEGGLGLGADFGKLPIDRQLAEMKTRSGKLFGSDSPSVFAEASNVEKLIQRFLVRAQAISPAQSSYNAALVLLSSGR